MDPSMDPSMDPTTTDPMEPTQQVPQIESHHPHQDSDLAQHVSQAGNVLEVDSERSSLSGTGTLQDDRDSAYGETSDVESAFTSISSSVRDYRKENGRTYHAYKDGRYHLPNDEIEASRLDLQHHLFLLTLDGRLSLAPIGNKLEYVLDIGTGTGIWALDFADQHPLTKVIGTDLSPVQPEFVAPNTVFLIDDSEETWEYKHKFDYIHGRMLIVAIKDFPRLLEQCYENLNPGCWVEMQDICFPITSDDGSLPPDSALSKWSSLMIEAGRKVGFDPSGTNKFATQMAAAGFVNIQETVYKWPLNSWPKGKKDKLLGRWGNADFSEGVQGFSMAFLTRVLGWTQQEVEVFLVDVRKDLRDKSKHSYVKLYVVYGQKPGDSSQQLQDDSVFGSNTAEDPQSQHQQEEEMVGSSSFQEPPHRQEESVLDSNTRQQPQTQESEDLLGLNTAQASHWQQHADPFDPDITLQPQPLHPQDQDIIGSSTSQEPSYLHEGQPQLQYQHNSYMHGSSSAQEPPPRQDENLFDSNSVPQSQAQQDNGLLGGNDVKPPQQHPHDGIFGSSDAQQALPQQQEGGSVSGSSNPEHFPSHQLQVEQALGPSNGQGLHPEQQQSESTAASNQASQTQPQQGREASHEVSATSV